MGFWGSGNYLSGFTLPSFVFRFRGSARQVQSCSASVREENFARTCHGTKTLPTLQSTKSCHAAVPFGLVTADASVRNTPVGLLSLCCVFFYAYTDYQDF